MPTIKHEGIKIDLDDEGYLVNFEDWSEKIACALADREGVSKECPLTKERMDILKFIRVYYKQYNSLPIIRYVCKNVHQERECGYEQFIDPLKAWKIAGLPKPIGYVKHELKSPPSP